jgi:hypothetical protein
MSLLYRAVSRRICSFRVCVTAALPVAYLASEHQHFALEVAGNSSQNFLA